MKNFIKTLLRESLTLDLLEGLMDEDYPSQWNIEEFSKLTNFRDRVKYCENNLQRISSGSGRIAYKIDDKMVLKLAKNQKGVIQNEIEIQYGNDSYFGSLLGQTLASHPDALWVEMELARKVSAGKFKQLAGFDLETLRSYIYNRVAGNNGKRLMYHMDPSVTEFMDNNEFAAEIIDYVFNTDAFVGDLSRLSTWGLVNRDGHETLVLIDYGLSNAAFDSAYRPKKMQYYT